MPSRKKGSKRVVKRIVMGLGFVAGAASLGYLAWLAKHRAPKKKGKLLCPADKGRKPADVEETEPGDFIVVTLAAADGSYAESTWVQVIEHYPSGIVGQIVGEMTESGLRPIATDKHGFSLGQTLDIGLECAWDVYLPRTEKFKAKVLCGPEIIGISEALEDPSIHRVQTGLIVQRGDRAKIIVGPETATTTSWHEQLWTQIIGVSDSGQIITARIDDVVYREEHGLSKGDVIRFNRDCIIATKGK